MAYSATRAESQRRTWAAKSPEERRRVTANARRAHAIREIVEGWPELDEKTQARLRALLRPVPEAGGHDA